MRHRLHAFLLVLSCAGGTWFSKSDLLEAQQHEEPSVEKHLAETKFIKMPDVPDCFEAATELGHPEKEASVMLMRAGAGCAVPWHWHISSEEIMMVSGSSETQVQGGKAVALRSGDFFSVPPHHVMRFVCKTPCTLFLYTGGPFEIHYVDDNGKEISSQEALKVLKKGTRRQTPKPDR